MAQILHRLGYVRKGHLVAVTRDDLVGQYIGHTAPKTREVLKKAMGGVLFIDEAYYLYRPENERDYGQEAIEILLQVMENQRDDLVVILAGYQDRMNTFFQSNPGMSSRIAHHLDFPDYAAEELLAIASKMLASQNYRLGDGGVQALERYLALRIAQPHFANARSVRNALDRARLRQASRLFARARPRADGAGPQHHRAAGHPGEPGVPDRMRTAHDHATLQALIFDVDGTLADTERAHLAAFNHAFAEEGLDWHWDEALYTRLLEISGGKERILHYWHTTRGDIVDVSGSAVRETVQRLHDLKTAAYEAMVNSGAVQLRPGVLALMDEAQTARPGRCDRHHHLAGQRRRPAAQGDRARTGGWTSPSSATLPARRSRSRIPRSTCRCCRR